MKFPWVSRSAHEVVVTVYESELARVSALLDGEIARNARLLDRLESMQRAGFLGAEPARYVDTTPALPDEVLSAILARSPGLGSEMGRHLVAFATEELAKGANPGDVAGRIWGDA